MENIDKNMDKLLRDVSVLMKLKSEQDVNYNNIMAGIHRKRRIRIWGGIVSGCAAAVILAIAFNFSFSYHSAEQIDIDSVDAPMLITESGELISLDKDKSYRLELADNSIEANLSGQVEDKGSVKTSRYVLKNKIVSGALKSRAEVEAVNADAQTSSVSRNTVIIPKGYTYDIKFDDGSEAHLNSGSYIEFPKSFETRKERIVSLTGEGYFKVAKSDKPFIVKANGLYIKVYGTEFNVNTNKENRVEALLISGRVGVGFESDSSEIILKPNDMLVYDVEKKTPSVCEVNPQDYLAWMKGDFSCSSQPLYYLIDEISAFYGITINKDSLLDNQLITISLSRQLGYIQIMEILEKAFGLQFSKTDNKTYICKQKNENM